MKSSNLSSPFTRYKQRQWKNNYPKKYRPIGGFVVKGEDFDLQDIYDADGQETSFDDYDSLDEICESDQIINYDSSLTADCSSIYIDEYNADYEDGIYSFSDNLQDSSYGTEISEFDDNIIDLEDAPEYVNIATVDARPPEDLITKKEKDANIVKDFFSNQTHGNFARLWKRFYPNIKKYAMKIMGDEARAEDMAQETFYKAWIRRAQYDPKKSKFTSWLQNICKNNCLDTLKNDSKCAIIDLDLNDMCNNILYTDIMEYKYSDPVYYIVDENTLQVKPMTFDDITMHMYNISISEIESANPLFSSIIKMKDMDNMTLKEIAENLNIPTTKVRSVYYEMRNKIKDIIIKKHREIFGEYQDAVINRIESNYVPSFFKRFTDEQDSSTEKENYG